MTKTLISRSFFSTICATLIAFTTALPAFAADVAINNNTGNLIATSLGGFVPAQSFTATKTGLLSSIAFTNDSASFGSCTLTVYSGAGTGGSVLHSQNIGVLPDTITNASTYTFTTITLDATVNISSSSTYTYQLTPATCADIGYYDSNPYAGGELYADGAIQATVDLAFEIVQGDALDTDGDLTASATVTEPIGLDTSVDTVGEAVDIFDFSISDGGSADGSSMDISTIRLNVTGTSSQTVRSQITYRLNGPDASNVTGTYNGGSNTVTFTGLSLSIADGTSETYTINAYYNDNTSLTEDLTIILSIDGDTDVTVSSGTQMGSTSAVTNGSGTTIDVVASSLVFTTQPAGSTSGSALSTQPVVSARDAFGNTDVDFTETVTLTEASAGSLTNNTTAASSGVATFSGTTYTATADQQSFTLTANDQDGVGTNLPTSNSNAVTSDVVATRLIFSTQPAPLIVQDSISTNFSTVPVVRAVDANSVVDTGYSTGITLSEVNGAGPATMSCTGDSDGSASTVTLTPTSGTATFTNLNITYTKSGGADETFNLQASSGGLTTANSSQLTSQDIYISSATYNASTASLVVTGSGFSAKAGALNDIDASKFTFTGEGGNTYTLTTTSDAEISSSTTFTLTLSAADATSVNGLLNANGTSSGDFTTYNLAAADDWLTNVTADDTAHATIAVTVSNVSTPSITSATYDFTTGVLVVTGTGFVSKPGATNDVDVSKLTFRGEGGATYTLTSVTDVEITSATTFSVTMNTTDKNEINSIFNKDGTASDDGTTYNLAAAEDWLAGAAAGVNISDLNSNGIAVSNVVSPSITSATYDASTGVMVVTGANFVNKSGAANDVDISKLTLTGQDGQTYSITSATDVEITSTTVFSVTLSATDKLGANAILNKNGTTADSGTTYNLAADDNWLPGSATSVDISDATNPVTVSNVSSPNITSGTYNATSGVLVVTGTSFVPSNGSNNDVDISQLTIRGEAGTTYTLTSSSDVDIVSATSFSVSLSGNDKLNVDGLLNKNGTSSDDSTTYNLAAADNWMRGAATSTDISDATNGITVSAVASPTITSATYNAESGTLVVTGTRFAKLIGGSDVDVSMLTLTGEGGGTITLTTSSDVEVSSATSFTVNLSPADKNAAKSLLNKEGTSSLGGQTYNLAAADNWLTAAAASVNIEDLNGNAISVSNLDPPTLTSATYTQKTGELLVSGALLVASAGPANDIDVSTLTFVGEAGATHTLTTSPDVEISSASSFTVVLSATDKTAVDALATKVGIESEDETSYNLVAADNWLRLSSGDISDNSNAVTVLGPEMSVTGNDLEISSGDITPSTLDNTDFGRVELSSDPIAKTFTILNTGNTALSLDGTPKVSISGVNAASFSVTTEPEETITDTNGTSAFVITFGGMELGEYEARVTISSDDFDESSYTFDLAAIVSGDNDDDGIPDINDDDDDDDGVSDDQEAADGTNSNEADSLIERFETEVCVDWNGFLSDLVQVLELRNVSGTTIDLSLEMQSLFGQVEDTVRFSLEPNEQRDVVVNDLKGFVQSTYGTICVTTVSGQNDALDGQYAYYKFTGDRTSFVFAFAEEFLVSRKGVQYLGYNNIVPKVSDFEPIVAVNSWVQLTNREETPQRGSLVFYNIDGTEIARESILLSAKQRRDFAAHELGLNQVGLIQWIPTDPDALFKLLQNRYYQAPETKAGISMSAQRGTGQKLVTPFDTRKKLSVLEVSNTRNSTILADLAVFTGNGEPISLSNSSLTLAPHGTTHIVLNSFHANAIGNLTIDGDTVSSLIVNLIEYGLDDVNNISFVKRTPATEGVGATQSSSYNSYLGGCRLRLGNKSADAQDFTVSMTRFDGTALLDEVAQTIPGNGVLDFDLCGNESGPAYGQILIAPITPGLIGGEIIRQNSSGTAELGVSVRP